MAIDCLKNTISILGDLVSFNNCGGESNLSIAGYMEDQLKKNDVQYFKVYDETGTKLGLHCRIGPAVDGGMILSGHMDVVPTKGQTWARPDFKLTKEGSKLYGRGTTDMKGFLACCLASLPLILEKELHKPIYLAFSYDEEVGCLGAPRLIDHIQKTYAEKPSFAIIGEPTSMITVPAEKGISLHKTIIKSNAAHSSEIRRQVSAINEGVKLVQWLSDRMEKWIAEDHIDSRFDPNHSTLHVGTITGGVAPNIIADHCEFLWEMRNLPQDDPGEILEEFQAFCEKQMAKKQKVASDFKITTTSVISSVPALETPKNSHIVDLSQKWSQHKKLGAVSFASEAGLFSNKGYQTVLCGPGNMEQGHTADEYIEIDQLKKCIDYLNHIVIHSRP